MVHESERFLLNPTKPAEWQIEGIAKELRGEPPAPGARSIEELEAEPGLMALGALLDKIQAEKQS